jgi:hypothetical protein
MLFSGMISDQFCFANQTRTIKFAQRHSLPLIVVSFVQELAKEMMGLKVKGGIDGMFPETKDQVPILRVSNFQFRP